MNSEHQIKAIAEFYGFTQVQIVGSGHGDDPVRIIGIHPELEDSGLMEVPDFYHDLKAVHLAEEKLDACNQREMFPEILAQVVSKYEGFRSNGLPLPEWHRVHSTSAQRANAPTRQRAKALLRTIGKWID